jgi:hypothetical protein
MPPPIAINGRKKITRTIDEAGKSKKSILQNNRKFKRSENIQRAGFIGKNLHLNMNTVLDSGFLDSRIWERIENRVKALVKKMGEGHRPTRGLSFIANLRISKILKRNLTL